MKSDPSKIIDLHEQAMDFADKARSACRANNLNEHDKLMDMAFELEKEAALMIKSEDSEPTRSVLHRSAASLAFRCKKYREAERLISRALSGNPPGEILNELRRLNRKVYFQLRLEEKELSLSDQEFSMNLDGNQIIEGLAPVDLITQRITKLKNIFWNTIRNEKGLPFGSKSLMKDQTYTLWVSALEPGSIDVILKLGVSGQMSLSNMGGFDSIFNKVMTNFHLLNKGEYDQLLEHITNEDYYSNFVALAKEIAPDGDNVVTVNFGALVEGQHRQVNFLRQQQEFSDVPLPDLLESDSELLTTDEIVTVRGTLQFADSLAEKKEVRLRETDTNVIWKIHVPNALMKDVVQPHFDEDVEIAGKRMKRKRVLPKTLFLTEIQRITSPH